MHVKTLRSQKLRMLLTQRKLLQARAIAVENDLRATLRTSSGSTNATRSGKFSTSSLTRASNLTVPTPCRP